MSAKLFNFVIYGMNESVITYIPIPGTGKPFTISVNDEDIQSLNMNLELKQSYVTFGAVSSMISRGMIKGSMVLRR